MECQGSFPFVGRTGGGTKQSMTGISVRNDGSVQHGNPMMNPNVLKILFGMCPSEDLKSMRLVCKTWHEHSLSSWRQSATLKVVIQGGGVKRGVSMMELLWDIIPNDKYKMASRPFASYCINEWQMFSIRAPGGETKSHFWSTIGPLAKRLEFFRCNSINDMIAFTDLIFKYTPNAQEISLNGCQFMFKEQPLLTQPREQGNLKLLKIIGAEPDCHFPLPWMAIFRTFPNLEALTLKYLANYGELDKILRCIGVIRQEDSRTLQIKRLEIINVRRAENQNLLLRIGHAFAFAKLPLEFLNIDLGVETGEQVVQEVLKANAGTLKTLHAFRAPFVKPFPSFPMGVMMQSLTELQLWGPIAPNLTFLKFMPNLKRLLINGSHMKQKKLIAEKYHGKGHGFPLQPDMISSTTKVTGMTKVVMKNLEELELELKVSVTDIKAVGKWMPNLKKLRMPIINNEQFRLVCELWPGLESFELMYGSKVDEEGITGIKNAWIKTKNAKGESVEVAPFDQDIKEGVATMKLGEPAKTAKVAQKENVNCVFKF